LSGPQSYDIWYASSSAAVNLTGLTAATYDGKAVLIINIGSFSLTLKHLNAGSSSGNQFQCSTGADIVVPANGSAVILYQTTSLLNKWRVL
jgi:hypothetical protein